MRECRRAIPLDTLPAFPEPAASTPCLHFIAAWGPRPGRAPLAEEALLALEGNREFVIRNLRAGDVRPQSLDARRAELEAACRRFAQAVDAGACSRPPGDVPSEGPAPWGALFGDPYERDAVAREIARLLLSAPPDSRGSRP
ncbi:MAG: hypothetical protein OXC94_09555 [Chloroflexi bacterium]|nr:hypothetical protein [Chloroflexota bacterium]